MRTNEDIDRYLIQMGLPYESPKEGIWVIRDENETALVVMHSPPVTVFRIKLTTLPKPESVDLLRKLLTLNASEMLAGAYGIEDGDLVLSDTLQSENLDFNEFRASVESMLLAVRSHYPEIAKFLKSNGRTA